MIATYGHGTENDFVLIFDPKDENSITTAQTAAICNRETGIGADGLIRIIKRDEKWFMDYRNADGSIAEMCGTSITQIEKTYYHTTEDKMVSNALADYEYRDGMLIPK